MIRTVLRPAVVVGVGGAAGVSAVRRLGRRGIPVYAVDHRRSPLGFHSRYSIPVRTSDPGADAAGFVAGLLELAERIGQPAPILPARDEDLNVIAQNRDQLGDAFLCPFPSWSELQAIQSKRHQVMRASEIGIPVPETSTDGTPPADFPVLVKPSAPAGFRERFGVQALRCETARELADALSAASRFEPLVQEFIPGGDGELYTVGAYVSASGEAVGVFCGRKIRQSPPRVGTCRVGESVWVDELVESGLELLRALGFTGIAQVEFKRDTRDGLFKFIEVNPRLWQWHELAASCGVDIPWIAYLDLLGQAVPPVTSRGRRRRWALTFYDNLRPAFVRPPYVDPFFARDDPRVALSHCARVARSSLARR